MNEIVNHHTPGPWIVERGHQTDRIYGIKGVTRWNFLLRGKSAEAQANARLIAAAPDMLDMLLWLDRRGGLGLDAHERIAAVVAKASSSTETLLGRERSEVKG